MSQFAEKYQRERLGLDKPLPEENKRKRVSVDEALDILSEIARDEEAGADRFRALKIVTQAQSANIVLPEPMSEAEAIERGVRFAKGLGLELLRICARKAYPNAKLFEAPAPVLNESILTKEDWEMIKSCRTHRMLNRLFPHLKRSGVWPGYPKGRSPEIQVGWCQDQCKRILIGQRQKELDNPVGEITDDEGVRTEGGTEVPQEPERKVDQES
jgi:hypothetical protein